MNYYTDVLKKYAVFTGRAGRKEYWMFVLMNIVVSIIVGIVGSIIGTKILSDLYVLAVLIPSIAVGIRRLHDTGKSGWWILIGLIPIIGTIIFIVFACQDSQPGDNAYGPNPKGMSSTPPSAPAPVV
jgi:uncharacterized membrane protein YhaH (DUF805 family)